MDGCVVVRGVGGVWSHLPGGGGGPAHHHLQDQGRQLLHLPLLHRRILILRLPGDVRGVSQILIIVQIII